jgi:hypothetical protein
VCQARHATEVWQVRVKYILYHILIFFIIVTVYVTPYVLYICYFKFIFVLCIYSVYSLQTSEDSLSQGTGGISEMSDEAMPILGRRATREKINSASRFSDDSDSDIDIYKVILIAI